MSLEAPSARETEAPYRQSARRTAVVDTEVTVDLGKAPDGRKGSNLDASVFRDALGTSDEWDRVWVAVWLAYQEAWAGKALEARVVLETALETVHTPAYRALLLARLAQHSASIGAPGLAKKFLKARPRLAIAEIESEVRAARALIAHAKGEMEDVIAMTGDRIAGDGYQGTSVILAVGLNIAANGRVGRTKIAETIATECARNGILDSVMATMQVFRISTAVITNAVRRIRIRSATTSAVIAAAVFAFAVFGLGYPLERTVIAGVVSMLWTAGFTWWSLTWKVRPSKASLARRKLAELAGTAVCIAIPMFWLVRTTPPAPPPAEIPPNVPTTDDPFPPGSRVEQGPDGVLYVRP